MRWRSWAGEIVDLIDLDLEGIDYVVAHQFEMRIAEKMRDICLPARKEVIHADDVVTALDQAITKMAAKKSGTAGNKNAFHREKKMLMGVF